MEIKDIDFKDVKNWSFNELDNAINSRKKDIEKLEGDIRKLREFKWQKTCEEMKSKVVDSGIDFSPELLLQQFFLKTAEAEVDVKPAKPKSKSSRSKKDTEKSEDKDSDDDAHSADENSVTEISAEKNSSPEKTATDFSSENNSANNVATDISVEADNASEEKLTTEEADVPKGNLQPIPEPETASIEIAVEDTPPTENVELQNFANQNSNTDALNNPADELFEEPTSQTTNSSSEESQEITKNAEVDSQSENSSSKELKVIARNVGLPADASFAEVRRAFDEKRYEIPPSIANNFAELLSKLERGEIA